MKRDTFWWRLLHLNPVLFRSAVVAIVTLATMFGILLSPALPDNLTAVVTSVGALIAAVWSRDGVTPNDKVVIYQPDPVDHPSSILPGPATAGRATDAAILSTARSGDVN